MPARWLDPGPLPILALVAATPVQPTAALALAATTVVVRASLRHAG